MKYLINPHQIFIVERGHIHLALEITLKRILQPLDITFNVFFVFFMYMMQEIDKPAFMTKTCPAEMIHIK